MIDYVIDKTVEVLKKELSLANVREWRKINGLVPSKHRTVSVGCDEESFSEYTNTLDECHAILKIYASLDNRELPTSGRKCDEDRLEYGERAIREFAENIRLVLADDYTLNGLIDASTIDKIEFLTADDHLDLHIAVISFAVKFYAERSKNLRSITMPITIERFPENWVTPLPITPVVEINSIDGFEKDVDYQAIPEGIQWTKGCMEKPIGTHLVSWKFNAISAKVEHIHMVVNGEETDF